MSDSGKQIGECRHGRAREWCPECLRAEVERLRAENAELRGKLANCAETRDVMRATLEALKGT